MAVFLAAILTPPARRLEERGVPPAGAALIMLAAFVAVVGTLGYLVTASVQTKLDDLTEQARQTYREVAPHTNRLPFIPAADELFGEATADGDEAGPNGEQQNGPEATESSVTTQAQEAAVAAVGVRRHRMDRLFAWRAGRASGLAQDGPEGGRHA